MNKCGYCGMKVRTDNPVEFWCGSVGSVYRSREYRSRECMENEIGLLKEHVRRLEKAGDAAIHEASHGRESDALEVWNQAKEAKP
jgi:hypothetical protein